MTISHRTFFLTAAALPMAACAAEAQQIPTAANEARYASEFVGSRRRNGVRDLNRWHSACCAEKPPSARHEPARQRASAREVRLRRMRA